MSLNLYRYNNRNWVSARVFIRISEVTIHLSVGFSKHRSIIRVGSLLVVVLRFAICIILEGTIRGKFLN